MVATETMQVSRGWRASLRLSETSLHTWLLIPPLIVLLCAFAYPLLDLFLRSFSAPEGIFGHYFALLRDSVFLIALTNTLKFALITGVFTAILGFPVALLIASVRPTVAGILLLLVMVPFWTSILVRSYAWIVLLGRNGILNSLLLDIGLVNEPLALLFNSIGVSIGMIHVMLPYMILPILSVMSRTNLDLLAAAESLGANRWQVFWRVLLPLTLPGILGGFVLVFVLSLGFFVTPALLGGPRDLVAAMTIREKISLGLAWDEAAAASVILLVLTSGTFLACLRIFNLRRGMSWMFR